jgi:hypothetical protein
MSNAVKILPHYTYTNYAQWEGRWELIDGQPFAMSPSPVPKHQLISMNLSIEFGQQLKKCDKCNVYQPIDYLVKDDTIFQPDMLVVCGEIVKNTWTLSQPWWQKYRPRILLCGIEMKNSRRMKQQEYSIILLLTRTRKYPKYMKVGQVSMS